MNAFLYNNLAANPGFEADGKATQTSTGWTSYANTTLNPSTAYNADYTETSGQSGTYRLTHYLATAYQASTYQVKTGLANGTYTLKAWVRNGGGQKTCQLYAKNFGAPEMDYALPIASAWPQVQLTGIQVANGQCEIGLWSDANAGNYCSLDNVEFFQTAPTAARGTTVLAAASPAAGPGSLYPNPAADVLTLALPAGRADATVRVYSPTGQTVLTQTLTGAAPSQRLDTSRLAPGLYQVQLEGSGRTETRKFVKR